MITIEDDDQNLTGGVIFQAVHLAVHARQIEIGSLGANLQDGWDITA
jgi:hypothetical protein